MNSQQSEAASSLDRVAESVQEIDLESAKRALIEDDQWPVHLVQEVELEYRRYLLLRLWLGSDIASPSGLVQKFQLKHDRIDRVSIEPEASESMQQLYFENLGRKMPEYWFAVEAASYIDAASPSVGE